MSSTKPPTKATLDAIAAAVAKAVEENLAQLNVAITAASEATEKASKAAEKADLAANAADTLVEESFSEEEVEVEVEVEEEEEEEEEINPDKPLPEEEVAALEDTFLYVLAKAGATPIIAKSILHRNPLLGLKAVTAAKKLKPPSAMTKEEIHELAVLLSALEEFHTYRWRRSEYTAFNRAALWIERIPTSVRSWLYGVVSTEFGETRK